MGMKSRIEKELIYADNDKGASAAGGAFIVLLLLVVGFFLIPDSLKPFVFAGGFLFGLIVMILGVSSGSFWGALFGLLVQELFIILGNNSFFTAKSGYFYLVPIGILIIFALLFPSKKTRQDYEDIPDDNEITQGKSKHYEEEPEITSQYLKHNIESFRQRIDDDIAFDEKLSAGYPSSLPDMNQSSIKNQRFKSTNTLDLPPLIPIPENVLEKAIHCVGQTHGKIPFSYRGIQIHKDLIRVTMEILNAEPTKTLPQNARNDIVERTPDGLDRRIKLYLQSDLRTANIITDVLEQADIVENTMVENPNTGRSIKGTRLKNKWTW